MSASVPDACEVLPGKSPRFDYHTLRNGIARTCDGVGHFDYAPGPAPMREAGCRQRAISRTTFKCTLHFSTLHFPRKYRTGPRGL